jgi:ubiquinone/menaquinone biosynthesis C-methylase UbiE
VRKADYSKIAEYYDKSRAATGLIIDLWMGVIDKYINKSREAKLLDIGCGTGRFTLPIAKRFHCPVTGADMSTEMLEKAKGKDKNGLVRWEIQDIHKMTYGDASFDVIFMSNVIHHCDSPLKALRECHRILGDNGVILIRYGAIEQIREDVTHVFFPETLKLDEKRTPSVELLEKWMTEVSFNGINTQEVEQKTFQTDKELLDAHACKNTSVLSMISEDAFEIGMQRLRKYVGEHSNDPWLFYDWFSMTTGYKVGKG